MYCAFYRDELTYQLTLSVSAYYSGPGLDQSFAAELSHCYLCCLCFLCCHGGSTIHACQRPYLYPYDDWVAHSCYCFHDDGCLFRCCGGFWTILNVGLAYSLFWYSFQLTLSGEIFASLRNDYGFSIALFL